MKTTFTALTITLFAFASQAAVRHRPASPVALTTADFVTNPFPLQGETIQFTDRSSGSPSSWSWSFGDGTTSTLQNPTHAYAMDGTFTVELCVNGARGAACTRHDVVVRLDLTGTWKGRTNGSVEITFVILQQGMNITGTGEYKQLNRSGKGPLTGTVAGRDLTFTNEYPIESNCTGVANGILTVNGGMMSGDYESDDCGVLEHGTLTLVKQ